MFRVQSAGLTLKVHLPLHNRVYFDPKGGTYVEDALG